jgi:8-oxo-dGTP pyrophosphatase MutT (NUDIX family)
MLPDFILKLKAQLAMPLPGAKAQYLMSPLGRVNSNLPDVESLNPRRSSVLILIYPKSADFSVVFIKRTEYNGVHSGQISFPGGKFEPSDLSEAYTAIREAKEEIGVDDAKIQILGSLSKLYIPPSNFLVSPFVGFIDEVPAFKPDTREVASIIEANIPSLLNAFTEIKYHSIPTSQDMMISAPCIEVCGHRVWGATAMISSEFVELVKKIS